MAELQRYLCIKEVDAEPMNYGSFMTQVKSYNHIGHLDYFAPGYHVVYSMGKPEEYHSWSPKKAFDEGYVLLPPKAATS